MTGEPASRFWTEALAPGGAGDEAPEARDALRTSMAQIRRDADHLATRIAIDLPEFTVHDGGHLDALWPLIDLIAPRELKLTPTEVWTLGVSIVLHDLGLAVAAYPGGRDELRQTPGWPDARAAALRSKIGRSPTPEELEVADGELDLAADATVLRQRHAERASELLDASWDDEHLLADKTLRDSLGDTAGKIAASHWWSVEELGDLGDQECAPADMSQSWTVRPILLAGLLRLADAAHLDASRAPRFGRALRQLSSRSAAHWEFQGRLRQPILDGERLRFVSGKPFPLEQAEAWWLCLDHLRCLDEELVAADSLFQAHGLPRMAARSVQGARDPLQLATVVRTDGWEPVDARVEVSDVSRLIQRLGGRSLYGQANLVPLRELIQNAADSVRARQALQEGFRGAVEVRVSLDGKEIAVKDDGVGMGVDVLTGALLDFGRSLWESEELSTVLPGLQAVGFQPTGRFGIGFFSIFIWADQVDIVSRARGASAEETRILSFFDGPGSRPVLRSAAAEEQLQDSGTIVRLRTRDGEDELSSRLQQRRKPNVKLDRAENLKQVLGGIAPALEVDLNAAVGDNAAVPVLEGGDWRVLPGRKLLERIGVAWWQGARLGGLARRLDRVGSEESPAGRAALDEGRLGCGVLVAGGLRVGDAPGIAGILTVDRVDASRTHGVTVADHGDVAAWATRQADLVLAGKSQDRQQIAAMVYALNGDPKALPLAKTNDGHLDREGIVKWAESRDEVAIVDALEEALAARDYQAIPPEPVVTLSDFVLDATLGPGSLPPGFTPATTGSLQQELIDLVAAAWNYDDSMEIFEYERDDLFDVEGAAESVLCIGTMLTRGEKSADF